MIGEKFCFGCERFRPIDSFLRAPRAADGHRDVCRDCCDRFIQEAKAAGTYRGGIIYPTAVKQRIAVFQAHRKYIRNNDYHVEYRKNNKQRLSAANQMYRIAAKDKILKKVQFNRDNAKLEGIVAYGGKCACCGESNPDFLTVHHVNGRKLHEKKNATNRQSGKNMWRKLRTLGWPKDDYQLLCTNCNFAIGLYGSCPHTWSESNLPDTVRRLLKAAGLEASKWRTSHIKN